MAATDFFTVEVLTAFGIVRYWVMFVIELSSRRVPHVGWTEQIARHLTDPVDGFLRGIRYLIHDRDALFTERFAEILKSAGVQCVKLPARSPNLNAYAERFVRSIRVECLDRIVARGERHLRYIVSQYVEHFLLERNHQGLGNRLITGPPPANLNARHAIHCRERLGGLLRYYHREVA
jgi:transposase InsO family protein